MTAISVVVARMMPSSVRKLRSLLERSDAIAPFTASQNEACPCISTDLLTRVAQQKFPSFSDSLRNLQPSPSMSWVAQVVGVPAAEANVERAELFLGGMPSALDVARPKP